MKLSIAALVCSIAFACAEPPGPAFTELALSTRFAEFNCSEVRIWIHASGSTRIAREQLVPDDPFGNCGRQYRLGKIDQREITIFRKILEGVVHGSLRDEEDWSLR